DNNGTVDVAVANVHATPDVFLTTATAGHHWVLLHLTGTRSNRSAIGARVRVVTGDVTQIGEVQGGGRYLSQTGLRLHVGPCAATRVDSIEVRWPNGQREAWSHRGADTLHRLVEGEGTPVAGGAPAGSGR